MLCYQELLLPYGHPAGESNLTSVPVGVSPLLWRWQWYNWGRSAEAKPKSTVSCGVTDSRMNLKLRRRAAVSPWVPAAHPGYS